MRCACQIQEISTKKNNDSGWGCRLRATSIIVEHLISTKMRKQKKWWISKKNVKKSTKTGKNKFHPLVFLTEALLSRGNPNLPLCELMSIGRWGLLSHQWLSGPGADERKEPRAQVVSSLGTLSALKSTGKSFKAAGQKSLHVFFDWGRKRTGYGGRPAAARWHGAQWRDDGTAIRRGMEAWRDEGACVRSPTKKWRCSIIYELVV